MAVKRVITQHFSVSYDYLPKERPNIYEPSKSYKRESVIKKELETCNENERPEVGCKKSSVKKDIIQPKPCCENNENNQGELIKKANSSDTKNGLDSIIELKEKLPVTKNASDEKINTIKSTNCNNPRPEEENNWRRRKNIKTVDKIHHGFKYRNFNQNFNNSHHNYNIPGRYQHHNNYHRHMASVAPSTRQKNGRSGIEMRNWRNECLYSPMRACGMMSRNENVVNVGGCNSEFGGIGLSPPNESLLMQRRLRLHNRASDIQLRGAPTTASG